MFHLRFVDCCHLCGLESRLRDGLGVVRGCERVLGRAGKPLGRGRSLKKATRSEFNEARFLLRRPWRRGNDKGVRGEIQVSTVDVDDGMIGKLLQLGKENVWNTFVCARNGLAILAPGWLYPPPQRLAEATVWRVPSRLIGAK